MDADFWDTVRQLTGWLDENRQLTSKEELLARIMKITEEAGEDSQAVLGALGQNPRKDKTNGFDLVTAELVDVMVAAAVSPSTRSRGTHWPSPSPPTWTASKGAPSSSPPRPDGHDPGRGGAAPLARLRSCGPRTTAATRGHAANALLARVLGEVSYSDWMRQCSTACCSTSPGRCFAASPPTRG